jgi:hypothetical protein
MIQAEDGTMTEIKSSRGAGSRWGRRLALVLAAASFGCGGGG